MNSLDDANSETNDFENFGLLLKTFKLFLF